jgi:hypothetical protein
MAVVMAIAAVMTAVMAAVAGSAAAPAASIQDPAARSLAPYRRVIHTAGMSGFPVAAYPYVAAAVPIPVAWRPDISRPARRSRFVTPRRRRTPDHNRHADLGACLQRRECAGSGGHKDCCVKEAFHLIYPLIFLLECVWQAIRKPAWPRRCQAAVYNVFLNRMTRIKYTLPFCSSIGNAFTYKSLIFRSEC